MAVVPGLFSLSRNELGCNMDVGQVVDLTPLNDGGVRKMLITKGDESGEYANYGDTIYMNYIAYNGDEPLEGNIFDSSERQGSLFSYEVMKGQVIRGFEMAALTMLPKERAQIFLKPDYGFGRKGAPPLVPAETNIIFDTEIVEIRCLDLSHDQDQTLTRKTLVNGKGYDYPCFGTTVKINIQGWIMPDGPLFLESRDAEFEIGEGTSALFQIPKVVEDHIDFWRADEEARLEVWPQHAYKDQECTLFDKPIPPNSKLAFRIKMYEFKKKREFWMMNNDDKLELAIYYKNKGNGYYKRREYEVAETYYQYCIDQIINEGCMPKKEDALRHQILFYAYANMAETRIKLKKWAPGKEACDMSLRIKDDDISTNVYLRRAVCQFHLGNYEDASKDFDKYLSYAPSSEEVTWYVKQCKAKMADQKSSQADIW